ncbi:MAG: hypothetical protein AB7D92_10090, partial [Sphaerochaeta sp.]
TVKQQSVRRLISLLVVLLATGLLFATTTTSGTLKLTGAYGTGVEAKLDAAYQAKIPVLEGEGPLFSGNNVKVKANLGLSPIAGTVTLDAVLTPIAVAEISLGGGLGTGWDFDLMDLEGLKLGTIVGAPLTSDSLNGLYYMGRVGAAFQFDTGAIFSGDWMSVVMRSYHELNYKGFSNASSEQAWEYENGGAMINGFNYKGEYILGYQMPLMVNLVGLQLETYAYNLFDDATDMVGDLSVIANTQFTEDLSLLTAIQFTNYSKDETSRVITKGDSAFKRVALILSYAL